MKKTIILFVAAMAVLVSSCTKNASDFNGTVYEHSYTEEDGGVMVRNVNQFRFTSKVDVTLVSETLLLSSGKVIDSDSESGVYSVSGKNMKITIDKETVTLIIDGNTLIGNDEDLGNIVMTKK